MSRSAATVITALLCVSLTMSHAASGPISAPGIAPSPGGSSSLGGITQSYPLRPLLNGTSLPDSTILQNVTIRCVGENLADANQTFRTTLEQTAQQIFWDNSSTLEIKYRPGVMAPVYGPSGLNGSRTAYAPTPGQVPVDFGRKLLQSQKPFNKETYSDRYTVFMSVDVEILARGGDNASVVQIKNPSQLMGYLSVLLAQRSMQIQTTPINISISSTVLPIAERIPLPATYVLGTVLQVTGTEIAPVNTQPQTMMMQALLGLFGSQSTFLFNRIGAVWSASRPGEDVVRLAIYTYTNSRIDSMNEIAGGDVASLMQQIAQSTGANFTVLVISSQALGTQAEELSGNAGFDLDIATPQAQRSVNSSSNLDGKEIAGIVIGCVAGAVIALGAVAGFLLILRRRQRGGEKDAKAPVGDFLNRAILSSFDNSSSAFPKSRGSTTQSSQNSPRAVHFHPLSDAWNINPAELAVCQLPNGKDWMLGSGSFGQVFRGLRGGVQDVAIKQIIKPGDMHVRMFEKEVALLRHLNFDKNLVQFYGACFADDNLMLVLEYMDGGDLKEAIGNDPVGEFGWYRKGGSVLKDVARGLHFLHSNRVAHRDLKTKNILLTRSGDAKIADVGLAKLVGSQLLSTQLDTAGTFAYAAPELLLGEACDQSADIYSFGVILWEVITHQIPVRGDLRAIETPKEAPPEVADLIKNCLQRSPRARPSAKEIFEILQSLLATPGASLPPVLESHEARLYSIESARPELVSDVVPSQLSQPLSLSAQNHETAASGYTDLRESGVQTSEIDTSELHTNDTGASTGTNPVASLGARTRPLASA